jgi:hypothetical protein
MSIITLDFDPIEANQRDPLPEGTYEMVVATANHKVSQAGNPMLEIRLDVVDDPIFSGRSVFDNIALVPQAAWKLVSFLQAAGIKPSKQLDISRLVGVPLQVDVVIDTYEVGGERRTRNKVAKYDRLGA